MCIAVGKVSFDDWDMLTSSLGWIGFFEPSTPPASSMARFEITSLTFMLVWVPEPVCQILNGNSSARSPSMTSRAARSISAALSRVELAEGVVHLRGRELQDAEGPDERGRHGLMADGEMVQAALGLSAPVVIGGNFDRAHRVRFDAYVTSFAVYFFFVFFLVDFWAALFGAFFGRNRLLG